MRNGVSGGWRQEAAEHPKRGVRRAERLSRHTCETECQANRRGSFVMIPSTPMLVSFSIIFASSTVHT